MYWRLVAIFLHASINHCFGVFLVAKSIIQRFVYNIPAAVHIQWFIGEQQELGGTAKT